MATCPDCGGSNYNYLECEDCGYYNESPTMFDVMGAVNAMGATSLQSQTASNFFILYEDEFTVDDYADFIEVCNTIREDFVQPYVDEVFGVDASTLNEEQRRQIWNPDTGLPRADRQAILNMHVDVARKKRIVITQDYNVEMYPIFYYSMRI